MRVLFVAKDAFYLRNFESLVRALVARGHQVHVAFESVPEAAYRHGLVEVLTADVPGFSAGVAPKRRSRRWRRTAAELRRSLDFLPYLHPRFEGAASLRGRAARLAPATVRRLVGAPVLRSSAGVRALASVMALAEEAVPTSATISEYIRSHRPDVLIVSPLVQFGSRQVDFLRSGRRLGVPTCFCAYSWDNLTTKGRIRGAPDLVTVWNHLQRHEAIDLHGVAPERVVTVGATAYDHWFGWQPGTSRKEFCRLVGLRPDRPYVLYVGSALLSGDETDFMATWAQTLRRSNHAVLREAGILVRPHPQRMPRPGTLDLSSDSNAATWPPPQARALGLEARQTLFDSIFHAAAVVGLNTSAFIDSAIIGRPSYAILPPEFRDSQEGTLHFRHLREAGGGLLTVGNSFAEHAEQLAAALLGGGHPVPRECFIEAFVRPAGIDVAATDVLADAIERQAKAGPRAQRPRPLVRTVGAALALGISEAIRWRRSGTTSGIGLRRGGRRLRRTRKALRRAQKRLGQKVAGAISRSAS